MTGRRSGGAAVKATAGSPKAQARPRPQPEPPVPRWEWMAIALGALWLVVIILWARGALRSGALVLYLLTGAAVAVYVARAVQITASADDGWRTSRKALLLGLLVAVPVVFDSNTAQIFEVPKYALVVVGAFALMGLWAIGAVRHRCLPWTRNGLRWPVMAFVGWTALTTVTSVNPRFSALGAYDSYDGLYATLAFAAVLFVTADTFSLADLKTTLGVLYLGGGGLVVLYGLIQLHDVELGGRDWDWIRWAGGGLTSITANLGNANYVGGFLAILFPIGLTLLLLFRSPWMRSLIGLLQVAIVAEMVHTASRGAWLAVVVCSVALALLLVSEARRRPVLFASVALACLSVTIAFGLTLSSSEGLRKKLDPDQLSASEASTVNQRVELWSAAARMANDRPLVGVGPDAFGPRFFAYQSATFTERYGTRLLANGAHNVFFNQLATQGYPGLVALVALIGSAAALGATTWRSFRRLERDGVGSRKRPDQDGEVRRRAREGRLAVAAIGSGLLAYVIQASFNVQKTSLSFVFWALLGLLCVAARAVGAKMPTARWGRHQPVGSGHLAIDLSSLGGSRDTPGSARRPRREPLSTTDQFFVYGIAFLVILGLIGVGTLAAAPWRADRAYDLARDTEARAQQPSPQTTERVLNALHAAQSLNPWEPLYYESDVLLAVRQASRAPAGSQRQLDLLNRANGVYRKIIRVGLGRPSFLVRYGDALLRLHQAQPTVGEARDEALVVLRRALRLSPRDPYIAARLRDAEQA